MVFTDFTVDQRVI